MGASCLSFGLSPAAAQNAPANCARPSCGMRAAASYSGARSASVSAPSARARRRWISGSGSVPSSWGKERRAQLEHLARKLQVEERRLPFFVLRSRRQDVLRGARRLGHRHVDHHREQSHDRALRDAQERAGREGNLARRTSPCTTRSALRVATRGRRRCLPRRGSTSPRLRRLYLLLLWKALFTWKRPSRLEALTTHPWLTELINSGVSLLLTGSAGYMDSGS